jgi:uncharacterized protein involved in outer membrane biogenesis
VVRALFALFTLALIVLIILFRWDWLRGPLAHYLSGRLHRPVSITGHLHVRPWSWTPEATIEGLAVGAAPWAGPRPMVLIPRLKVQARLAPLILRGELILPLLEADAPTITLLRDANGRASWQTTRKRPPRPLKLPAINHLIIRDGHLSFVDIHNRLSFVGTVSSNEEAVGSGRGAFALDGAGELNGEPFEAAVRGGSMIDVKPTRPYDFVARARAGETRLALTGRIDHPFDLGQLSGHFDLTGPDLADLYGVTGLALPNSPPYDLSAGFARRQEVYALRGISGRVGESDLGGSISVDNTSGRPFLTAELQSRRLRLADAVAIVGGAPPRADPGKLSPKERVEGARLRAEHRLLPDSRLDIGRVRGMDAQVTYRATQIAAGAVAMRDLRVQVGLDHGLLTIDPASVDLSQGRLQGMVRIDARRAVPMSAIDLRLSGASLASIFHVKRGADPAISGDLWARARLSGSGASVREAAAHAQGSASLVVPGGQVRKTIANMLGVNLDRTAFLLLTRNKTDTPIRCAVADFKASDGVLTADRVVVDTGAVQGLGSGDIDLRDETLNLRLKGRPKKFSLLHLNAPITLTGSLAAPKIGVDLTKAIPQAAGAVALGVVAAPLAAILPFIGPGLAKNADCQALALGGPGA